MSETLQSPINPPTITEFSLDDFDRMLTELRERRTRLRVRTDELAGDVPNETPQIKRERYAKFVEKINAKFAKIDELIEKLTEDVNKLRVMNVEIN